MNHKKRLFKERMNRALRARRWGIMRYQCELTERLNNAQLGDIVTYSGCCKPKKSNCTYKIEEDSEEDKRGYESAKRWADRCHSRGEWIMEVR